MPGAVAAEAQAKAAAGEREGEGAWRGARGALVAGPGGARCSAALLGGGWALTAGAALGPALLRRLAPHELPAGRLLLPPAARRPRPRFTLLADASDDASGERDDEDADERTAEGEAREPEPAALAALWRCALLSAALRELLAQWALSDEEADAPDHPRAALPVLAVLRVGAAARDAPPDELLRGARAALGTLLARLEGLEETEGAWRGRELLLEASPFGSAFFLNAWSGGVASGAAGPRGCLLLADARAAPGCEGAPAFLVRGHGARGTPRPDRRQGPVALVVAPVSWWRGEWVGFTLLAALRPVLRALLQTAPSPPPAPLPPRPAPAPVSSARGSPLAAAAADASVVLVRCGGEWGSGVAVDVAAVGAAPARASAPAPPLVLTCAHVVRNAELAWEAGGDGCGAGHPVRVWWRGRGRDAHLLYRTPPGRAFDVAVLRLDADGADTPRGLRISQAPARRGERVLAAGFALFSEMDGERQGGAAGVRPLLAAGEVARARPALLQTTCVAQSGASGGAVLRPSGELLALLVCNVRDALSGALYPHFSMAAPAAALREPLLRFGATGDVRSLDELDCRDLSVQRLWELQMPAATTSCKL